MYEREIFVTLYYNLNNINLFDIIIYNKCSSMVDTNT